MAHRQAGIKKEYVGWYVGKCRVSLKSQYANKRPIETIVIRKPIP